MVATPDYIILFSTIESPRMIKSWFIFTEKEYPSTSPPEDEQPGPQLLHRHAWSEDEQIEDLENAEHILIKRDALANAFTWGTTTQRYGSLAWYSPV